MQVYMQCYNYAWVCLYTPVAHCQEGGHVHAHWHWQEGDHDHAYCHCQEGDRDHGVLVPGRQQDKHAKVMLWLRAGDQQDQRDCRAGLEGCRQQAIHAAALLTNC